MANWGGGYTITDTSLSTLKTNLTNFFTSFLPTFSAASNGWIKFPGGILIQWGTLGSLNDNTPTSGSFPVTFPNAGFAIVATDNSSFVTAGNPRTMGAIITSTSAFDITASGSGSSAFWIAVGH
jgi:hypothetical protein